MPDLPARPNLDQLRHRARDLLRDARGGDVDALARVRAVSDRLVLASAQLAIAREHGFASWTRLKLEVERRDVLNGRDPSRLARLLARHPESATTRMEGWSDHRKGADVLGYLAMLRLDHRRLGLPRDLPGSDVVAASRSSRPPRRPSPGCRRGRLRRRGGRGRRSCRTPPRARPPCRRARRRSPARPARRGRRPPRPTPSPPPRRHNWRR